MAAGLSLVAGGGINASSDPAKTCSPAKAGAQSGEAVGALRASGPLPSQGYGILPAPDRPTLSELFPASSRDGGATGLLLAQVARGKPLLWVQERMAVIEAGRIYPPGLGMSDLIHVTARDARAALWAMEEGLRCSALGAVIGEIWGDPKALDFTATRRLAVAAERYGVAAFLIRLGGHPNLSGARMRWRVASAPSLANALDPKAPGTAVWDAELFRARGFAPGRWMVSHEKSADRLSVVAAAVDRTLVEGERRVG